MERVTGIGGFFFRADDPDALARWYAEHLGVGFPPEAYEDDVWYQEAGPTVFAPFGPSTGRARTSASTAGGSTSGCATSTRSWRSCATWASRSRSTRQYPNGRFASLHDPEGNAVQLWEPA